MSNGRRIWKFGDDVNTDLIISGKYLDNYDPAHLAAHAMEGVSKEFSTVVSKGDMIVAGANFGCGSSREQAVIALMQSGIELIIAKSFARIFYRNAINLGLTVVVSSSAPDVFHDGELAEVDPDGHRILSMKDGRSADFEPVPSHVKAILDEGGLIPYVRRRLKDKALREDTARS